MKLSLFNEGLSTRVAPELIKPTESVVNVNVDFEAGQVESRNGVGELSVTALNNPWYWQYGKTWQPDAHKTEYLAYQAKLYYTGLGSAPQKHSGGTTRPLGLVAPTTKPSATVDVSLPAPLLTIVENTFTETPIQEAEVTGDFPALAITWYVLLKDETGLIYYQQATMSATAGKGYHLGTQDTYPPHMTVSYARDYLGTVYECPQEDVVYDISSNPLVSFDLSEALPKTGDKIKLTAAIVSGAFTGTLSAVVSHTFGPGEVWLDCQVVETPGTIGPTRTKQVYRDSQELPLEDVTSVHALGDFWEDTGTTGTLQYVYTYYDVLDGTESAPSPLSVEAEVHHGSTSYSVIASSSPDVTHIKVYRIGANLLTYTEVAEHPNVTATYADLLLDGDVVGESLDSVLNNPPPSGLRYLVESHGVFFGADGHRLHFSDGSGNPNYWPATYSIDIHDDITGLAVIGAGVAVFTRHHTFLISGTSATTFVKYTISSDQGCIHHKSIVSRAGSVFFASADGICTIIGNDVKVVSKRHLGNIKLDVVNAVLHDEVYYLQLVNKDILVLDHRYGLTFQYLQLGTTWLAHAEDVLYGSSTKGLTEMFKGEAVEYSYTTGNLGEGALSNLKTYDEIYVAAEGSHTLDVLVDGFQVSSFVFEGASKPLRFAVPQEYQRGSTIQFKLKGIGKIKELEYKAIGRTNGQ